MKRTVPLLVIACVFGFALTSVTMVNGSVVVQKGEANGAEQPIEITAQKLRIKFGKENAEATYDGNVKVKQGDMTMKCDRLVIGYGMKGTKAGQDPLSRKLTRDVTLSNMRSIIASGNVKIVQGDLTAVAGKAVFDNNTRTIELTDHPKLWRGPDRSSGSRFIFYIDENRSEADGVTTRISPGSSKKEQEK
jgi:lipopolysaccharide export system protein LptA